jgi:hypothetical protein
MENAMKKIGFILATFLLIGMIVVLQPVSALKTDKGFIQYTPSKEFIDYINAPVITPDQKDVAQKIVEGSAIFQEYASSPRGETTCVWAYPYTRTLHLSAVVGSPGSDSYGLIWFDVDPRSGAIQKEGFSNWMKYW